ncbi:TniQ protein [Paenibacillus tianmuensis]|uniref:TniQ protein n=1 Tax=Paenibacillus tianmuensis TaxID=624147 RepID=A0A1G4TP40_9BACL|nr:TnsD family Tn7-like transposition protein [Paenibacillus tianmuensis]SCW83091.1 TniQ protein [Paenibacillus tianmuensis]
MNKLNYFPKCYPDEDFRSIVYRYHLHTGNLRFKQSIIELFGRNTPQGIIPQNLEALIKRLPEGQISIDKLLNEHSFFPLYRPFLPNPKRVLIEESIKELKINTSKGVILSTRDNKLTTSNVRYCPHCLLEDFETFGECYLHRLHQTRDLDICHHHQISLVDRCPTCLLPLTSNFAFLSEPYCSLGHPIREATDQFFELAKIKLSLIGYYEYLFTAKTKLLYDDMERLVKDGLTRNGFVNQKGTVNKKAFFDEFINSLSEEVQECFGISKEYFLERWAYNRLLKPKQFLFIPNVFLLILRFLKISLDSIKSMTATCLVDDPFGDGPWECVNVVCPSYKSNIITKYTQNYNRNKSKITGFFQCEICGFVYSKGWPPDQFDEQKTKIGIRDRGKLWRNQLLLLHRTGLSGYAISKKLQVDRAIIYHHLRQMGVNDMESGMNEISMALDQTSAATETTDKETYRSLLLGMLKQDPQISRSQLARSHNKVYLWLLKNDRLWFAEVLPYKIAWESRRIDYEVLDEQLVVKVKEAAQLLYHHKKPTQRILKSTIINQLEKVNRNQLNDKKDKFPKTRSMLEQLEEKYDDYQFRNLPNIINKLRSYGNKNPTFSSLNIKLPQQKPSHTNVCLIH